MQEWPKGSLEETVQNAIKSWEMELTHKTRLQDFKSINPDKFKLIVNGTYTYTQKLQIQSLPNLDVSEIKIFVSDESGI